jgi:hypothetical protein
MDTDRLDCTRVYEEFWGLHTRAIGKNHDLRHFALRKNLAKKSKYTSTYQIVARQKCYRMDTDRPDCTRVQEAFWGLDSLGIGENHDLAHFNPQKQFGPEIKGKWCIPNCSPSKMLSKGY